ncbi:hypothetical protein VPH35_021179 [Triticum aestivum]
MREQAMCRDTASREPEPRHHQRHANLPAGDAPVVEVAPVVRQGQGSLPPATILVTPALEVVHDDQPEQLREQPDMHEAAEEVSDAMSTAADEGPEGQLATVLLEEVQPNELPPADLAARALSSGHEGQETGCDDIFNNSAATLGMMQLYSPPTQQSLFCFSPSSAWPQSDAAALTAAGVASYFGAAPDSYTLSFLPTAPDRYALLPLPPSLGTNSQQYWMMGADANGNFCQPMGEGLPLSETLGWFAPAPGPEVIFGPGAPCTPTFPCMGLVGQPDTGFGSWRAPAQSMEEQRARHALAEANLSGPGLVAAITARVADLHVNEQRAFVSKIAALLSSSVLGASPAVASGPQRRSLRQRLLGAGKGTRQSAWLVRLRSSFSTSRRTQAAICVKLGIIKKAKEFSDDTLLAYIQFFRAPMPPENMAKLAEITGLSSPTQLRLPDEELQAILEELSGRAP